MLLEFKPYWTLNAIKYAFVVAIIAWAVTATVAFLYSRPATILIGLDENGTRIITSGSDQLLTRERLKFVKDFLYHYYNYTSADYEKNISYCGDFMNETLWKEKSPELQKIASRMKDAGLVQEARLLDLRENSETEFEADLAISIKARLSSKNTRYRIVIALAPHKRTVSNPYAWEVSGVQENEVQ